MANAGQSKTALGVNFNLHHGVHDGVFLLSSGMTQVTTAGRGHSGTAAVSVDATEDPRSMRRGSTSTESQSISAFDRFDQTHQTALRTCFFLCFDVFRPSDPDGPDFVDASLLFWRVLIWGSTWAIQWSTRRLECDWSSRFYPGLTR